MYICTMWFRVCMSERRNSIGPIQRVFTDIEGNHRHGGLVGEDSGLLKKNWGEIGQAAYRK